jgi:uncharacterized protein
MICVELVFNDDPRRLEARPAHRDRLAGLHQRGAVLAAGPWEDDSGALLIFTLGESEVRAELAADPYYSTPGVTVASTRVWAPVFGPAPAAGSA